MMISKEVPIETSRGPAVGVISQLNGVQAMRLFMRLANRLGPALPAMKAGGSATLLAGVLERIDADEYERIQNETLSKLVVRWPDSGEVDSNAARNLGEIFTGQPFELGRLVWAALDLNFGNFFERLRSTATGAGQSKTGQH